MKARADVWTTLAYPFGSEMAWDSTGQEEVYAWTKHFGDAAKARVTLDAILGYMPTLPHWGYNGSARRYWDFLYAGKIAPHRAPAAPLRVRAQRHSGARRLPRRSPTICTCCASATAGRWARWRTSTRRASRRRRSTRSPTRCGRTRYSGDYGQNFFGHALNAATYLVRDPRVRLAGVRRERRGGTRAGGTSSPLDAFRDARVPGAGWPLADARRREVRARGHRPGDGCCAGGACSRHPRDAGRAPPHRTACASVPDPRRGWPRDLPPGEDVRPRARRLRHPARPKRHAGGVAHPLTRR